MKKEKFKATLLRTIDEKNILKHPFYIKWNEGKLTKEELREYSKQYYKFVENFPMFVSAVHSNCPDSFVRNLMMENLADEEGFKSGCMNHPQLWLNFCVAQGISRDKVLNAKPVTEVKNMVEGFYKFCRSSNYKDGIAALFTYESQIPEVSKVKIDGLRKFYGIESPEAVEFFTVHKDADVYHSKTELNVLLENCTDESEQNQILKVAGKAASLYWKMLDGMYVS